MKLHVQKLIFTLTVLLIPSADGDAICDSVLATKATPAIFTNKQLQSRLNSGYRESGIMDFKSAFRHRAILNYRLFNPFKVREGSEFFPGGKLRPVHTLNDILIFRMSRQEGIEKLKWSFKFNEERGWIFVPALNIWFYDSVQQATATRTVSNALLAHVLIHEFGEIEMYHNHPTISSRAVFKDNIIRNYTFEQFVPTVALPSASDCLSVSEFFEAGIGLIKTRATGYVISEFGLTKYWGQAFAHADSNGTVVNIKPSLHRLHNSDLAALKGSAVEKIKLMLVEGELNSITPVVSFTDQSGHTSGDVPTQVWPQMFFEFLPRSDP